MNINSLEGLDVRGKRALLRCDLNVPIKDGVIADDGRIRASLPTIQYLISQGASVVIMAHLGRPKGERKPELSLAPVAKRLGELLGQEIGFSSAIRGAGTAVATLNAGDVLLLENIRFEAAETSKDDSERLDLARELASYADCFISDGFGAVHRKHASVYDVAQLLPHAAGYLVLAEVEVLKRLTDSPERPYGVVLGGAKVSDKIGVISNLLDKVNILAIGGGMLFTFLAAQGKEIGASLVETDLIPTVKELLERAKKLGVTIL
ncbi:MAG: phosphoglycerate kinase, partial [Actinobacteria bacterium]|nr:phosphoglycerate kinase [Actinomycetota bacterium]